MFNIMLDELPEDFEGYPINTDFRIGIQIEQLLADGIAGGREKTEKICELLFSGIIPHDINAAVEWFLTGWYTDNPAKSKETQKIMDYDKDQWRIYSAFKNQYEIDLQTDSVHYWKFMGLISNLEPCAFTRVMDIRGKKITNNMAKEDKAALKKAKEIYQLEQQEENSEESYEKEIKKQEAIDTFRSFRK